jgi:hypothetical protein
MTVARRLMLLVVLTSAAASHAQPRAGTGGPRHRPVDVSPPAASRAKIAVLVLQVGEAEAELADNLTEVLIAEVARKGTFAIVGKEEFRSGLGVAAAEAAACLEQPACLGRAGTSLGVTKVAAGTIGKRGAEYAFSLNLIDIATAKVESRVFKIVAGGVTGLISTLQAAAVQLFAPRLEPGAVKVSTPGAGGARVYVDDAFIGTTPVRSGSLEPGTHRLRVELDGHRSWRREVVVPAGATLDMDLSLAQLPPRRVLPAYVVWIALGGAVVTGATGTFFGVLSHEAPGTATRAATLRELDRKQAQARTATGLFASAGALVATSAAVLFFYRKDIFGGAPAEAPRAALRGPTLRLAAVPLPGGGAVSGLIEY